MNVIYTPAGIIHGTRPGQGIMDIRAAGLEHMLLDMTMFCSPWELENMGKDKKKPGTKAKSTPGMKTESKPDTKPLISETPWELYNHMKPMLDQYEKAGISTPVARAPYLTWNTEREDLNHLLFCLAQESIRVCKKAGCKYIIIRPLSSGIKRGEEWEANKTFYLKLADTARENHVVILLENQCRDVNGHLVRGVCSDAVEAGTWVDRLNQLSQTAGETQKEEEDRFGFCMDAGTCNLCAQNMQEFLLSMGSRLKTVILRDCDGQKESSMLPFTCSGFGQTNTDWLGLIRGLRAISFDGQLILNGSTTAGFFSPLLRPQLLQLTKAVGDYFRWQIEMENLLKKYNSIALFGAGNMCRNYMKCYGTLYPPLFTCDNNSRLWGTEFCGLEVKPPKSLKDLPKDCGIFICNIYYREIEKQLRDMGIDNAIEYFNDEYMPSFYFDRIERGE